MFAPYEKDKGLHKSKFIANLTSPNHRRGGLLLWSDEGKTPWSDGQARLEYCNIHLYLLTLSHTHHNKSASASLHSRSNWRALSSGR